MHGLGQEQPTGQACATAHELHCQGKKVSIVLWRIPTVHTPFGMPNMICHGEQGGDTKAMVGVSLNACAHLRAYILLQIICIEGDASVQVPNPAESYLACCKHQT